MTLPQSSHMTIQIVVQLFRPIQPMNSMLKLLMRPILLILLSIAHNARYLSNTMCSLLASFPEGHSAL